MPILPYSTKAASTAAAGGQTLYDCIVATSGGDYTTVTAAITAGKVAIFVRAGTYTEAGFSSISHNATDNLTIVGADPNTTILNFGANSFYLDGANVTISNISFTTSTGTVNFGGNYTSLINIYHNSSNATNYALATGGLGVIVNGLRFIDSASIGSISYRCNFSGSNTLVTNCFFFCNRNGATAFVGTGSSSAITSCSWYFNSGAQGGSYMVDVLTRSTCSGCTFYNQGSSDGSIRLSGNGAAAIGNTTDGGAKSISITASATYCTISGNVFNSAGSGTTAISVASGLNVITGNSIRHRSTSGSTALGIVVSASCNNNTITGNIVTNAFVGLTVNTGATNTVVVGNTFTANGTNLTDNGTTTVNTGNITV